MNQVVNSSGRSPDRSGRPPSPRSGRPPDRASGGVHRKYTSAPHRSPATRFLWLLPALVVLPTLALLWRHPFDGLYGQDAYSYYRYATGPLRQQLLALQPPPPFFWPPGYPLLVALLSLLVGMTPAAGQAVSLAAGALVPLFTALLARELWPSRRWTPLLAGIFAAAMPQLWQSSAVVMSDTTGLAAATLGVWALARYGRRGGSRWLALAAAALAFAVLTRWALALVAVPSTAYALYMLARQPRRAALYQALLAALVVIFVLSPVISAAIARTPTPGVEQTSFFGDLEVVSWHPLNALRNEFTTVDGQLRYRLPNGLYYALAPAHRYYFTPLLALLLLPGLWRVWKRRSPARLLLLFGWAGVIYAGLVGTPYQSFRFTLGFLPPLAIIAAVGLVTLVRWLPGRVRWLPLLLAAAALLWMGYGGWTLTRSFIERKEANLSTMRWVEAQTEAEARLFTFGITLTFEQYSDLEVHDVFLLTPDEIAAMLRDGRPAYVLLDVDNVVQQWAERAPGGNYRWLEREKGLAPLGQHRHFSFFRVGGG